MKKIAIILFLFIVTVSFGQTVKLKKGEVFVNDVAMLKYENCTGFKGNLCSIFNMKGDEIIFMKIVRIPDPKGITRANSTGEISFYEVSFLGTGQKVEIDFATPQKIMEYIYKSKAVNDDGTLNDDGVSMMVEKYGNNISNQNVAQPPNTIIIQEAPRPRNGININLGR